MCSAYDRRGSLRSAGFDRGRLPGIGADGRYTGKRHKQRHRDTRYGNFRADGGCDDKWQPHRGHSGDSKHNDGWLGNRIRRERRFRRRDDGQPTEQPRQWRDCIGLWRCFRWVFGERDDGTFEQRSGEQRSGVGAVPAIRILGNAALRSRDESFLRALAEFGDRTRAGGSRTL